MHTQIDPHTLKMARGNRIIGIEFLDASKHISLNKLFPIDYEVSKRAVAK